MESCIEMTGTKAFRTFSAIHSTFKIERLRANINVSLHKAVITSVMTRVFSARELETGALKIAAPVKQGFTQTNTH
jgi:hypothetical protein